MTFSIHTYRSVLSHVHFRTLWIAQIFSQLAVNMLLFVIALTLYKLTHSNTSVSLLFLFFGLPALFGGIFAGVIVDKMDKRFVLFFSDCLRALLVFSLLLFKTNVPVMYAFIFLFAIVTQLYVPTFGPFIPLLVPIKDLLTANSLFSLTYYSSMGIGFVLAGPILRYMGIDGALVFIGCLFLFSSILDFRLPRTRSIRYFFARLSEIPFTILFERVIEELLQVVRYIRIHKTVIEALWLLTMTQILFALFGTLGPGVADKLLGIDIRDSSLVIIGPAVLGILIGAFILGMIGNKVQPKKLVFIGLLSCGILLIFLSIFMGSINIDILGLRRFHFFGVAVSIPLFFCLGVANSLLDVPSNSILQKETDEHMRSRVYGFLAASVGGGGMLPVVGGGILADSIGVGNTLLCIGVLLLLYTFVRKNFISNT
jgi:MFS family permease